MNAFDAAFAHILQVEGMVYTHRTNDPPTKYGITQPAYSDFLGRTASIADVKAMPIEDAKTIYRESYWDKIRADRLPGKIALALFDQAVNRGPGSAIMSLQRSLRIEDDGILGPITLAKIRGANEPTMLFDFLWECQRDYVRVVQRYPAQAANLGGWTNRVFHLIDVLCFD